MEKQDSFSHDEALSVITKMIDNTKSKFSDNSFYFLLWGWLVIAACLLQYILTTIFELYDIGWIGWPVLMLGGSILTFSRVRNDIAATGFVTKMDLFFNMLWLGFAISTWIVIPMLLWKAPEVMMPVVMALYGFGLFVSGKVLSYNPLTIGGIFCWGCSFIGFQLDMNNQLLVLAFAICGGYLIPGYLLKQKSKHGSTSGS